MRLQLRRAGGAAAAAGGGAGGALAPAGGGAAGPREGVPPRRLAFTHHGPAVSLSENGTHAPRRWRFSRGSWLEPSGAVWHPSSASDPRLSFEPISLQEIFKISERERERSQMFCKCFGRFDHVQHSTTVRYFQSLVIFRPKRKPHSRRRSHKPSRPSKSSQFFMPLLLHF